MILVRPSFEIEPVDGAAILQKIEKAGRVCYKSEDKITEGSAEKFVKMIIDRGHETVLEHAAVTVRVICCRGISHELVRHRIASYSQESTRYCSYNDQVTFIIPPWVDIQEGRHWRTRLDCEAPKAVDFWHDSLLQAEDMYHELLSCGWRPEQARDVLPNALKTEIVMTLNLRAWRHFFTLRTAMAAHPSMRAIAQPLLKAMQQLIPIVFDDIKGEIK